MPRVPRLRQPEGSALLSRGVPRQSEVAKPPRQRWVLRIRMGVRRLRQARGQAMDLSAAEHVRPRPWSSTAGDVSTRKRSSRLSRLSRSPRQVARSTYRHTFRRTLTSNGLDSFISVRATCSKYPACRVARIAIRAVAVGPSVSMTRGFRDSSRSAHAVVRRSPSRG